ncbi:MAG: DUF2637 domain-containing protein [Pseudonocardiaceae bacterium]
MAGHQPLCRAANRGRQAGCAEGCPISAASPAVRHTTTAAVAAVGLIAAIVSYSHMQQLGDHHGEAWRSWLVPISIDGLMAAASMVLLTRRRSGLPGRLRAV